MDKLLSLMALVRQAQEAENLSAFAHIMVNETRKLVAFKQAIFWTAGPIGFTLEKVSGNTVLDDKGTMAADIKSFIATHSKNIPPQKYALPVGSFAPLQSFITLLVYHTPRDGVMGGVWLETDAIPSAPEISILDEYAHACTPFMTLHMLRGGRGLMQRAYGFARYKKRILAGVTLLCLFPAHHSVTAPAEIVPKDADIITAPLDGLIDDVLVAPGDTVTKDQVLIKLDDTTLAAEQNQAEQALVVAESSLSRLSREALLAPEKKADISILQADINEKKIRRDYAAAMRAHTKIRAAKDGIAIFSDPTQLRGKPVRTGEPLMKIANPSQKELLIRVPPNAIIDLSTDATATFYMSPLPFSNYHAKVTSIGYEATPDAAGTITYKILATINDADDLRVGWQGTAEIKGEWTFLAYAILRGPLATLRSMTGL